MRMRDGSSTCILCCADQMRKRGKRPSLQPGRTAGAVVSIMRGIGWGPSFLTGCATGCFPGNSAGKESQQYGRPEFDPWIGKIPWRREWLPTLVLGASQMVQMVKNPPANAGDITDANLIPGLGRFLGEGHGNPLQYSGRENSTNRGAWRAAVHGVARSRTRLSD